MRSQQQINYSGPDSPIAVGTSQSFHLACISQTYWSGRPIGRTIHIASRRFEPALGGSNTSMTQAPPTFPAAYFFWHNYGLWVESDSTSSRK